MKHLSNDLIYSRRPRDGKGEALDCNHEARPLNDYLNKVDARMTAESDHLIYPVMLNVHGES